MREWKLRSRPRRPTWACVLVLLVSAAAASFAATPAQKCEGAGAFPVERKDCA